MKKSILLTIFSFVFFSCGNENASQLVDSKQISSKISSYYQSILILNHLNEFQRVATRINTIQQITPEEQIAINTTIQNSAIAASDLFSIIGVTQQELAAYKEEDVALAGLILSSEMIQQTNPESSRDVIDCLGRAAFGISIAEWALTGRITATMGIRLLGQVARRALGPIAVAFVIYDFVDCMTSYSSTATTGPSEATTDSTKTIPPTEAFVNQTTH